MNGTRQLDPSVQNPAGKQKTPIRTFSPEYERNPDHAWVVNRINRIVSMPDRRAEELESIKSAIFGFSMRVDCGADTVAQLTSLLDQGRAGPELRGVWELRAAAVLMLGGTRSKEAVPALISAFENESNLNVKEALCLALGVIGLEGNPLRRFSESLVMGVESARWEGAEKKSACLNFIRNAFYNSPFQPAVVLGEEQEEFLTQTLAGRRPGSEGPLNWPARASAALLLGASCSINTLPNLISTAAKKEEVQQVRSAVKEAAARMGRRDLWPTDVRMILNDFIAPGPGERSNPETERAAIDILRMMSEDEGDSTPMPHMPSSAELELQSPKQKFIGMLRSARESGDYYAIAREFPIETAIANMTSNDYMKISHESLPELRRMFLDFMRAAIRTKGPEVYPRAINSLVRAAVAELLEKKRELGIREAQPSASTKPAPASRLSPDERKFVESLREAYEKGDYSGFVKGIKTGEATRMAILAASARLEERSLPFLRQLTSDIILASVRARGQKAFMEAAEVLYDMALENEPYVHLLSQEIADMISTSKKPIR